jgi:hypothetical protein
MDRVVTSRPHRTPAELGRYASQSSYALSFTRCVLAWIALPLVLVSCAAMEAADQPKEICPNAICIVLATPDTINDAVENRTIAFVSSAYSYEVDTIIATLTTSVLGSLKKGRSVRMLVLRGSVETDQPAEPYFFVLRRGGRFYDFEALEFEALEAYPIKDGKVCTARPLGAYTTTGGNRFNVPVNPPSSERTNCYSVDDIKRKAW